MCAMFSNTSRSSPCISYAEIVAAIWETLIDLDFSLSTRSWLSAFGIILFSPALLRFAVSPTETKISINTEHYFDHFDVFMQRLKKPASLAALRRTKGSHVREFLNLSIKYC